MTEFKGFPGVDNAGQPVKLTIASGPVIIEKGKVLLDKHGDDNFWKFPGGRLADDTSPRDSAALHVKAELGLKATLTGEPFVMAFTRVKDGITDYVVLIHYSASRQGDVRPGPEIKEWAWHDVNNLPADCAPNIKPALNHFAKKV